MYRQLLLHQEMQAELQRLEHTKNQMEEQLKTLPSGSIYWRNGNFYHVFRVAGKQKMRAIKDLALLEQLQCRRYIEICLPQIKNRLKNCRAFLAKDKLYDAGSVIAKIPSQYHDTKYHDFWLAGDIDPAAWGKAEYEQNPYPIGKPSQTAGGRLVRSKSEAFIGSEIEGASLLHRYEAKLVISGEVFYPDFMFILPNTRRIVIWEHFGRMDDPVYMKKAMHKIEMYTKAGWILGVNFFFTFETEDMPFSFPGAKAKLAEILATDKVAW